MASRDGGPVTDPVRVEPADDPGRTGPGGPSRRRLLTGAGLFGAGAVAGGLTGYFTRSGPESAGAGDTSLGQQTIPFYGAHQAGIITPAQDRLAFGTMNVVSGTSRADLRDLLRVWTGAAARMTAGQLVGEESEPAAPPVDTGEAVGSPVSRLTITIGYGPPLFDDRFGLAARKPAALTDQPWLRGGSYMVARKIRMFVENWDRDYLQDQENVIGRAKVSGAPLSGGSEFTTPNFAKAGGDGQPAIPADAHIRLASPEHNGGIHILRRGYSFTDGIDPQAGTCSAACSSSRS